MPGTVSVVALIFCLIYVIVLLQELREVLFGSSRTCFSFEWRNQGFTFSETHDLRYGIVQKKVDTLQKFRHHKFTFSYILCNFDVMLDSYCVSSLYVFSRVVHVEFWPPSKVFFSRNSCLKTLKAVIQAFSKLFFYSKLSRRLQDINLGVPCCNL